MALTYGIESLAVINKGGGLRRLAAGQTTEYLRGDMTWTAFPTSMTPKAHNHAATEINSGTLDLARLPRIAAGSIYVGAGTSNDILTLAKGDALQALRTNADATALEWYTTPWKDGIGSGAIMTKNATAAGLRSSDESKPYVFFTGVVGESFKSGGLAGTDQSWAVIPPNTNYTYAYGGVEYTYNNTSSNYIFLAIISSSDFIGSLTPPFDRITLVANGGKSVLTTIGRTITSVSNITLNAYSIFASAGTTQPSGIDYTQAVTIYAFFKTTSGNYSGYYSVASGRYSVASGGYSVASGDYSVASGAYSVASGSYSVASGYMSVALGSASVSSAFASVALGRGTIAGSDYQTVIGKWNLATTDAFIIGNGSNEASRSNCMTVDFSGNMTLAGALTLSNRAGDNRIAYFDSAGILQSSASYTLSSFALAGHNHDDTYLKLSGGTVTGTITLGSTGGIYKSGWDGNRIAYFVSGDLTTSSDYTLSSFALAGHNHDTTYLKLTGGTLTGNLTMAVGAKFKNQNTGWEGNKIPYFVSGEMVVGTITKDSFANATHEHSTGNLTSGTLSVERGGTGKSSLTANAILLGGETATGALQQMSLGTARQVLASGGSSAIPQWLNADEYERFSVGGTEEASATEITRKTGISEKLVFIDPGAETTPQTVSFFKAPLAANQEYGDRIVIYCCSGNETYKYFVLPNGTEKFCDLIGGQYTGNIEASYGNKIELVCLPKSGAKAWYVSRIALINNN